jgi:hypothetical protein
MAGTGHEGTDPDSGYPGTPGWVKVFATVVGILVLIALFLIVGSALGLHTPGGHGP